MTELDQLFQEKLISLSCYFRHEYFYYKNKFDFTLREGKIYKSVPFTAEERKFVLKRIKSLNGTFAPNHCFLNSGKLAMADSTFNIKYVEGFIFKKDDEVPILHAWNEINGKVIDITLINKYGEYTIGTFEDDIAYRGTVFTTRYVRSAFSHKTRSRSILSDISDKSNPWPILKEKFSEEYLDSL
jgi:hypothetical protein